MRCPTHAEISSLNKLPLKALMVYVEKQSSYQQPAMHKKPLSKEFKMHLFIHKSCTVKQAMHHFCTAMKKTFDSSTALIDLSSSNISQHGDHKGNQWQNWTCLLDCIKSRFALVYWIIEEVMKNVTENAAALHSLNRTMLWPFGKSMTP